MTPLATVEKGRKGGDFLEKPRYLSQKSKFGRHLVDIAEKTDFLDPGIHWGARDSGIDLVDIW